MRYSETWGHLVLGVVMLACGSALADLTSERLIHKSGIRGGIVVRLGCDNGKELCSLRPNDSYLVCGLETDGSKVANVQKEIASLGFYGRVSAEVYDGKDLPYGDNVVNLIVIPGATNVTGEELVRALTPNGVVLARSAKFTAAALRTEGEFDGWTKYVKPRTTEIDDWTHYLYDASGNAVSKDKKVYRPRRLQWYAGPKRARHHDTLASMSAMTSSNGRVFYIFDEGPTSLVHRPSQWRLIARDAFNGKLLWKRDISDWMTHLYNFRAGPKQLPRRLVSVGDSVFVTLGLCAPTVKLDAATGKTLMTYPNSDKTEELIYHKGMLLAAIGDPSILIEKSDGCHGYWELAEHEEPTVDKRITAYDANSGKELWTVAGSNMRHLTPLSLSARGDNVFYLDNNELHCISSTTGKQRWAAPFKTEGLFIRSYAPTVVATDEVIMCLKWDRMVGYSVKTGKQMWEDKGAMGFGNPADLFAIGNIAWTVPMTKSIWRGSKTDKDGIPRTGITIPKTEFLNEAKTAVGVDIRTGKVAELLPFAHTQHHHRCYRNKATEKYLLLGHSGIQVVDLAKKTNETHRWVRGLCQYGIMPANGYLYVPPDTCRCYGTGKINGFFALAETNSWNCVELQSVLEKGPAYMRAANATDGGNKQDWPTYRASNARSGAATCEIPQKPAKNWQIMIGNTITAPVIADGKAYVADRDAYTVHCIDAVSGSPKWKFLANGPVDSPPTICGRQCIFGCGDGSVYCVDASTGILAWRFKTSAIERRVGHDDRLESPLRIHGSTLVVDNTVYFAAGYSTNLDGGIRLYGLDVQTGKLKYTCTLASGCWGNDSKWGSLADILVSDGKTIGMREVKLSKELKKGGRGGLLNSSIGLLDHTWFHRSGWRSPGGGHGNLIAFAGNHSISVISSYNGLKQRRKKDYKKFDQPGHFHQKFTRYKPEFFPIGTRIVSKKPNWSYDVPFQPRAIVLAGNKFCLAGWTDALVIETKTGRPKNPANPDPRDSFLRIHSTSDGKLISELKLEAQPVFDGMAAARGHLYLSLKNGKLICLGQ